METITADAIYQNGMIKVLTEVPLEENERIRLQIERDPRKARKRSRNLIRLHGIWKSHLAASEKNEDWVSATLTEVRRQSSEKIAQTMSEIEKALQDA
jgi:predicted DNA-binding antitoxin AbrB/MazE fold protein